VNKIIFLDIDGVLNSQNTFIDNHEYRKFFVKNMNDSISDKTMHIMLNIDLDKVFIDFNELENYLVKTSFYEEGLTYEIARDVVRVLRRIW